MLQESPKKNFYLNRVIDLYNDNKLTPENFTDESQSVSKLLVAFWNQYRHTLDEQPLLPKLMQPMLAITLHFLPTLHSIPRFCMILSLIGISAVEIRRRQTLSNPFNWQELFSKPQKTTLLEQLDFILETKLQHGDFIYLFTGLSTMKIAWAELSQNHKNKLLQYVQQNKSSFNYLDISDLLAAWAEMRIPFADILAFLPEFESFITSAGFYKPRISTVIPALADLKANISSETKTILKRDLIASTAEFNVAALIRVWRALPKLKFDFSASERGELVNTIKRLKDVIELHGVGIILWSWATLSFPPQEINTVKFPFLEELFKPEYFTSEIYQMLSFAHSRLKYPFSNKVKKLLQSPSPAREKPGTPALKQFWQTQGFADFKETQIQQTQISLTLQNLGRVDCQGILAILLHHFSKAQVDWYESLSVNQRGWITTQITAQAPTFTALDTLYTIQALALIDFNWNDPSQGAASTALIQAIKRNAAGFDLQMTCHLCFALAKLGAHLQSNMKELSFPCFLEYKSPTPEAIAKLAPINDSLIELFQAQQVIGFTMPAELESHIKSPAHKPLTQTYKDIITLLKTLGLEIKDSAYCGAAKLRIQLQFRHRDQRCTIIVDNISNYTRDPLTFNFRPNPITAWRNQKLIDIGWNFITILPEDWENNRPELTKKIDAWLRQLQPARKAESKSQTNPSPGPKPSIAGAFAGKPSNSTSGTPMTPSGSNLTRNPS